MRYDYWTIQATPDSSRLLSFGIGVLVTDEHRQDFRLQMIDRPEAMPVNTASRDAIFSAVRYLAGEFSSLRSRMGGLELTRADSPSALASYFVSHWNNLVTFDRPRAIAADSLNDATEILYDLYIGDPRSETAVRPITRLRRDVRSSYESFPEIRECLRPAPHLQVGNLPGEFDLALVRDDHKLFELNSSFAFTSKTVESTRNRIELWNFRVAEIRHGGGELTIGDTQLGVDQDAPIVATYEPPTSEAQEELFEQISRQWDSYGIRAVPRSELHAHTEYVAAGLRSA